MKSPGNLTNKADIAVLPCAHVRCRHWETTIVLPRIASLTKMDKHRRGVRTDAVRRGLHMYSSLSSCSVRGCCAQTQIIHHCSTAQGCLPSSSVFDLTPVQRSSPVNLVWMVDAFRMYPGSVCL